MPSKTVAGISWKLRRSLSESLILSCFVKHFPSLGLGFVVGLSSDGVPCSVFRTSRLENNTAVPLIILTVFMIALWGRFNDLGKAPYSPPRSHSLNSFSQVHSALLSFSKERPCFEYSLQLPPFGNGSWDPWRRWFLNLDSSTASGIDGIDGTVSHTLELTIFEKMSPHTLEICPSLLIVDDDSSSPGRMSDLVLDSQHVVRSLH